MSGMFLDIFWEMSVSGVVAVSTTDLVVLPRLVSHLEIASNTIYTLYKTKNSYLSVHKSPSKCKKENSNRLGLE